jgi:two-component system, NtrC family, sensor histidine kinase KinB
MTLPRLLLILAGFVILLITSANTQIAPNEIPAGAVIAVAVAILYIFPIDLFHKNFALTHILAIGGGLLTNAALVAWAVGLGLVLGHLARRSVLSRRLPLSPQVSWGDTLVAFASISISLFAALGVSGWAGASGFLTSGGVSLLAVLSPALWFSLLYSLIILADALLRGEQRTSHYRRDLRWFLILVWLPVPFVLAMLLSYPMIGLWVLLALAGASIILAGLLFYLRQATLEQHRLSQELNTLHQVSQTIQATLDMAKLLPALQHQVSQHFGVDNFYIAIYDRRDEKIWYPLAVKHGIRQSWAPRALADRLTDRVILERQPILIPTDASQELVRIGLPAGEGAPAAWMGVPLLSSDEAIGCLAVFTDSPQHSFLPGDLDLFVTLSGQVGVAIANALLHEQLQRRVSQLETLNQFTMNITESLDAEHVLSQVCQYVTQVGSGRRSAIYILDLETSRVQLEHACGLSSDFITANRTFPYAQENRTQCLRTGRTDLLPDTQIAGNGADIIPVIGEEYWTWLQRENIAAVGNFPLISPDGQIGYLAVYYDGAHEFLSEEVELLQSFTAQAAMAVANARLHSRTDLALSRRVHQLSILETISRELAGAIYSDRLFELILNYAMDFTSSTAGMIALLDGAAQCLRVKAQRGYSSAWDQLALDDGIWGQAIQGQKVINVSGIQQEAGYGGQTRQPACSHLSVPLIHHSHVLGVISLESEVQAGFTGNDEAFVSQLANQAAVAVINADLYRETQHRLQELSTLYMLSNSLAGNLQPKTALDTIGQAMHSAVESQIVGLYLWDPASHRFELTETIPEGGEISGQLAEQIAGLAGIAQATHDWEEDWRSLSAGFESQPGWVFPMVSGGQPLGLAVLQASGNTPIQPDDMQLLQAIVAQGTIALQNALLFTDVSNVRDRLAAVLNSVGEGILLLEHGGQIILANRSLEVLTDQSIADLVGKRLTDLTTQTLSSIGFSVSEVDRLVETLDGLQAPELQKTRVKVKDQHGEKTLERALWAVRGQSGRAVGWVLVLRDVTEEERVSQARELIGETLIHDLRSPVSAVLGALEVMETTLPESGGDDVEVTTQALQVARRGAQRVLGLIETLMDIARMQSGKMEIMQSMVDLRTIVSSALNDFLPQSKEYGVILRNEIPAGLPPLYADQAKIMRVVANLVDNALKYSPSGGQITVFAEPGQEKEVVVRVRDNGPGIPEEFRQKIFERFTQIPGVRGRRRGTGLGLTFCKLAVEAHSGQIWVEANPTGGSDFVFTLPVFDASDYFQQPDRQI